jgi:hypothetical protein
MRLLCSRRDAVEGDLCGHGPDIVPFPHWSCCGAFLEEGRCVRGSAHPWHPTHPLVVDTKFDATFDVDFPGGTGLACMNLHPSVGGQLVVLRVAANASHLRLHVGDEVLPLPP